MQTRVTQSSSATFSWWSALVGGAAAIGAMALLGTLVSNAFIWWYMSKGFSPQQANAQMGRGATSPIELMSLAALAFAGVFGGYVSATHGRGRHLVQGLIAGVLSTTFFYAMSLNPVSQPLLSWEGVRYLLVAVFSGLLGGYARARRSA